MTKMEIIRKEIGEITPDPGNVRKHSNKNIDAIKASLNRFGQQKPIVCDQKMVVRAGNGTLEAAKELGWTHINVVISDLDRADLIAYGIADNRTAELAEWDIEGLSMQLAGLDEDLRDIAYIDFDLADLELEDKSEPSEKDDEVPELEDDNPYGVEIGDIWQLGNHRVMCGDSTIKENVDKLMDGQKADMMFTSPPYSDLRSYRGNIDLSISKLAMIFDISAKTYYLNLGLKIKDRQIESYWDSWLLEAKNRNIPLISWLIWDKGSASAAAHQTAMFGLSHEWIFVFGQYKEQKRIKENVTNDSWGVRTVRQKDGSLKNEKKQQRYSHRQLDTIVKVNKAVTNSKINNHPAQYPVHLPETFILSHDPDSIVDPFLGSGSTLIACEKTNRNAFGLEIDPHYCSVIIKRYIDFVGSDSEVYLIDGESKKHISEVQKMRK